SLHTVLREFRDRQPGWQVVVEAELNRWIVNFCRIHLRQLEDAQHGNAVSLRLARVLKRMREEPSRAWTLGELAKAAMTSPRTLLRDFRNVLGTTPLTHLRQIRMQAAAELLRRQPALSIQEIAERVGFNEATYFSRCFRETFGCSPRQYRQGL
ncbi:MAG: AraC family transcriptional regulator, partial [Lentisphaerae bacterium]